MKLDTYDFRGLPPDLIEWLEECTDIINLSLYEAKSFATPPTASTAGNQGLFGMVKDGANWFLFLYANDTDKWQKVQLTQV